MLATIITISSLSITFEDSFAQTPTADAGPDQKVPPSVIVTLSGSGTHPTGGVLGYRWTQTSGPTVALSNNVGPQRTFTAPASSATLEFSLTTVAGISGVSRNSNSDTVTITVSERPTANAGSDQEVASGSIVTLDGSASTDPESDSLTYSWTKIAGPTVQLSNNGDVQPTFTAPTGPATITLRLEVNDGTSKSTDSVIITVLAPPQPPIADAGPDKTGFINDMITLDGTASTDPNGDALTYEWNQDSGTPITLDNFTSARTTFTAPSEPTILEFTLTVQDATHTVTDSITITIKERVQTRNIKEMSDTLISAQITAPNQITMTYNEELSTFINSYLNFTISGEDIPRSITGINGSPSIERMVNIDGNNTTAFITTLTFDGESVPAGTTGSMYVQHTDYYLAFIQVSDGQE
ncbi:MAG: PKD domain-containing protein [Thaumarchaeota archaeon]|nr:PKD domain-containing protein [Nitrososphaerota archaeon]